MDYLKSIEARLQQFIKKYYTNELIKGVLLFLSIGLLYFIFTLFIEYFLWLKPLHRSILFWLFISVELFLVVVYIVIPIFKIFGFKKGISKIEASKIIGKHFPEVNDKLLNLLQLKEMHQNSELIYASIEQKSGDLKLVPFKKAVNFNGNKKYIKYALIPIAIWLIIYFTGNINLFSDSFNRVVHYNVAYEAPAPFSFNVLNKNLNVIEGDPLLLEIETVGNTIPEFVKIHFLNEDYYLENNEFGKFSYQFSTVKKPISFYFEANGVSSKEYNINVIPTPNITNLKMILTYPKYTGKRNEVIENTGNAIVPQGTIINWQVETRQTDSVLFIQNVEKHSFNKNTKSLFSYSKRILSNTNYRVAASNEELKNYEDLNFEIDVIIDEYPKIVVNSNIDSVSRGPVHFVGQLSDDYGVRKLQLVYYNNLQPEIVYKHPINFVKGTYSEFYYIFPNQISIEEGINYNMFFEVTDNDGVNGGKKSKSKEFSYYKKTKNEFKEDLLLEQKNNLDLISKTVKKSKKNNDDIKRLQEEIQKKADMNWNDSKKIEEFINRQKQYDNLFKKQTEKLEQNINEQPINEEIKEKKNDLEKRVEEVKKLNEKENLLKELEELSKKINKEDLVEKIKKISQKNKSKEKSLERILELTKRFYVEQKANQISEKLQELGNEQEELANKNKEENNLDNQKVINEKFENIKKDLNNLEKENRSLKRPMKLPNNDSEKEEISEDLEEALKELNKEKQNKSESNEDSNAKKKQKSAAKKMKKMGEQMESSIASGGGESLDEDIDDLRVIVENLIEFSFQQEKLMNNFFDRDNDHPEYAVNLKNQHVLKEYFEHIDDSIYMLSLRLVKMSNDIQKEINEVHYNIDESIVNFSDNKVENGVSNQHFALTAVNNLANQLSNLLESLMNSTPSMGKGSGSQDFSLPDIIKKQGELSKKMEDGNKEGGTNSKEKNGEKDGDEKNNLNNGKENGEGLNEQMSQELFEIYKEQSRLKEMLKDMIGKNDGKGKKVFGDVVSKMEELENLILEKGFTKEVIDKMKELNHELLKLDEAEKEQGEDKQRKSISNYNEFKKNDNIKLQLENLYFNNNEILNRQSLPLRGIYKKKVQDYFRAKIEK